MFVNIQKAIELTGLSRSTLQRHIKAGKLTKTDKGIDTSELIRVYGELKPVRESGKGNQSDSAINAREEHQAGIAENKPAGFFSGLFGKK